MRKRRQEIVLQAVGLARLAQRPLALVLGASPRGDVPVDLQDQAGAAVVVADHDLPALLHDHAAVPARVEQLPFPQDLLENRLLNLVEALREHILQETPQPTARR